MEKIEIRDLTFTYPGQTTPALNHISLTVNPGEFVCICGKSGCGKSTLLRRLKPILSPLEEIQGTVCLDGVDILTLNQRQQAEKIGFVGQNPEASIVCDKVWHELAFGLESLSFPTEEIRSRVAEISAFFGIDSWYHKDVCELSGGQKQRLALASVMAMGPDLLVLDEPTSQLDPIAARDFLDTLSKINKELGTTIILSEHRLEEALPLADKVVVIDNGQIIALGDAPTAGKALRDKNHPMLYALPTPMRVSYRVDSPLPTPITVREGRLWLSRMSLNPDIEFPTFSAHSEKTTLECKNVWFRYEKTAPDILKGLSLKIKENEIYAIVGGNGAGKSTLLSAIMGKARPYRGKICISEDSRIACLPQNPQSLFAHKTLLEDLWEMTDKSPQTKEAQEREIQDVVRLCELEALLQSHPYDLSGGEAQRGALAKILLLRPRILLLDEPTKGLDANFKIKLGKMLEDLASRGTTIIMVSHDVEFCAKYAHRIGMFFDGQLVSEDTPRNFFSGKSFYTTAANRMARAHRPDGVTEDDIIAMLGGSPAPLPPTEKPTPIQARPCISEELYRDTPGPQQKLSKNTSTGAIMTLLLIPLTIFAGIYCFGDRKYYFISLLIILESMLPFALVFERRRPRARELVITSVLCALGVAGRVAFGALPQFKPVIALIIISGVCFGGETGFLVGAVTAFASNFYFSQGPWTPWQMFAYGITGFLAGILFKRNTPVQSKIPVTLFGFIATFAVCGFILNLGTVFMSHSSITPELVLSVLAAGLPMDLVHSLSTAFFLWLAYVPMCEKLERIKLKYGLYQN